MPVINPGQNLPGKASPEDPEELLCLLEPWNGKEPAMEQVKKPYPFRSVFSLKPLMDYLQSQASDSCKVGTCKRESLEEILDRFPELGKPIKDLSVLKRRGEEVQKVMDFVFPVAFWDSEAVACMVPFHMTPVFVSPRFRSLFLNKDNSYRGRRNLDEASFNRGRVIRAYLFILKKFYGIEQALDYPVINIISDPETGLDRHFKLQVDFRFVDVKALKTPKSLMAEEQATILRHIAEPEVIREILPPEDFEIQGFTILQAVEVTESEVLSGLAKDLVDQNSIVSRENFLRVQERLRTLLKRPRLVAGLTAIQDDRILLLNTGAQLTQSCIFANSRHVSVDEFKDTHFMQAAESGEILIIPDLMEEPAHLHQNIKEDFVRMGARSLLIAPLFFKGGCIGMLNLASPEPGGLGPMDGLVMQRVKPLFAMAIKRALDDLDNRVQSIIKHECTAIHPTVEWRFRKAALNYLEHVQEGETSQIESIVFKDVYPLYGVADIRGSTEARNRSIQKDLTEHLKRTLDIVRAADRIKPLLILRELSGRIQGHLGRIESGLGAGDELFVARFLQEEVETLFAHLRGYGPEVEKAIAAYESVIDKNVGTVYRVRKQFEESVSLLNDRLTGYLDQVELEAQTVFPHYFERHKTDGVDYLIYLGGALVEDGGFHELYLRNMRLWQLKAACGLAWHTAQLKSTLPVPLDTAHLILVQDKPLSIRFRYDEKRFDVDGAYDIRHDIIKSRIDKAMVRGGEERLTQPGKVAVVYSSREEEQGIRQHIDFLLSEGYLKGSPEHFVLDALPDVQGLKALRVEVDPESKAFADK
jgi:GAF domain